MLESKIQKKLIDFYQKQGYCCIKIIRASKAGIPDLLLLKNGIASFVEVKAEDGVISDKQRQRAKELRAAGCEVRFVTQGDIDIEEREIEVNEQYGF
ncbi:MAG: VRR-NUC domain-containing protein [Microcoleus sp.]